MFVENIVAEMNIPKFEKPNIRSPPKLDPIVRTIEERSNAVMTIWVTVIIATFSMEHTIKLHSNTIFFLPLQIHLIRLAQTMATRLFLLFFSLVELIFR